MIEDTKEVMVQESTIKNLIYMKGSGGRRYLPYVFTEPGIAMLSAVLRSDVAVQVSIKSMNAGKKCFGINKMEDAKTVVRILEKLQ